MFYRSAFKVLLIAIVVFTISTVAYAFAAANTVPDTYAGEGSGTISGYAVTAVTYTLNYADPSTIETVTFTLSPAATDEIKVSFDGISFFDCAGAGAVKTCAIAGAIDVVDAVNLTVVAWYTP